MNIYKFHTNPESLDFYKEVLTQVPKLAYEHAKSLGRRFPEGEAAIVKDPFYAYLYAADVIEGRWPEGEVAIAKDGGYAYGYARFIIKKRFPEGEAAIANSLWKQDYEKIFKVKL